MTTMSNKCLGMGYVKITGRGNFIDDIETKRMVELPYDSLSLNSTDNELKVGELLIYTAHLNDHRYRVHSACRPADLRYIQGSVTTLERDFKYAHMKGRGGSYRVFVPFSARNQFGQQWHGTNAGLNVPCAGYVFRQPEVHGCNYVAWGMFLGSDLSIELEESYPSCYKERLPVSGMKKLERPTAVQRQSDHQQVEFVSQQCGVIYDIAPNNVVSVSSPTCQNVYFTASLFEPWMKVGRFVLFDGRRVEEGKTSKLIGSNPVDAGSIFTFTRIAPLHLFVNAVLNKVSFGKAAWAWNDHIGRIYIPWASTDRYMNQSRPFPFTGVQLEVEYNGKHDDIPWVATAATLCDGEDEDYQIREENAQMLRTEDNWRVQSVIDGPENQSVFLSKMDENNRKVTAFAKVVDLNSGDMPAQNTMVRVTYYEQKRHQRHALRAVLVTTMEKSEKYPKVHIVLNGTGLKHYPDYFEEPTPRKEKEPEPKKRLQVAPAPVKNYWNLSKLGAPQTSACTEFPSVNGVNGDSQTEAVAPEEPLPYATPQPVAYTEPTAPLFPPGIPPPVNRSTSIWSGTPVEAKPEPFFMQHENQTLFESAFLDARLGLPSLYVAEPSYFSEASVSQPSSASTSGPVSEVRNTQSEASSPDPIDQDQTFVEPGADCTYWNDILNGVSSTTNNNNNNNESYQPNLFGFARHHCDLPIYKHLRGQQNDQNELRANPACCDTEQLLWDLWQNPRFIAAFSASDPEMFKKVEMKRKMFDKVVRDNRYF